MISRVQIADLAW